MAEQNGINVGKAYVQVIPSADGIKGSITKVLGGEADSAGQSLGSKLASTIKKVIIGAGIGTAITKIIGEGSELEQNLGGTEAVFDKFASNIQKVANDAYKNMGMSASDYMASANKMTSLLRGNGMEIEKAMNLTTSTMQRAADVASVMGISTESAMEAINGAAKGNFTMMDNLGVAMNATTLEAYALSKGIKTAYKDMSNTQKTELAMQMFMERTQNMAGNFARESKETISGSIGAFKSSVQDLMGQLAIGGDVSSAINGIVEYGGYAALNIGESVVNVLKALPSALTTGIQSIKSAIAEKFPEIIETVMNYIGDLRTNLGEKVTEIIGNVLPKMTELSKEIKDYAGLLVENGIDIILQLAQGIADAMPDFIKNIPTIVSNIVNIIKDNMPKILKAGWQILLTLGKGIINSIPVLIQELPKIPMAIFDTLKAINWASIGRNIMEGIKNGITGAIGLIVNAAKKVASNVWSSITGFFGIHSPSRKMAWAGQMLDEGLAVGIGDNLGLVDNQMDKLNNSVMDSVSNDIMKSVTYDVTTTRKEATASSSLYDLIEDGKLVLMLDSGEVVGALTTKIDGALGQLQVRRARG